MTILPDLDPDLDLEPLPDLDPESETIWGRNRAQRLQGHTR